jgi:hypothetical protein
MFWAIGINPLAAKWGHEELLKLYEDPFHKAWKVIPPMAGSGDGNAMLIVS